MVCKVNDAESVEVFEARSWFQMPGMSSGLNANDPIIVAAFKSLLLHQGFAVLLILLLCTLAIQVFRSFGLRQAAKTPDESTASANVVSRYPEASARRLLRIGFGVLWIFDGLLQAQPKMPLGMTTGVIQPAASASPAWVQHIVNAGATIWSYHPITAPASAVWIQVGIGLWLLTANRGRWSRFAGLAAVIWGLVVWIFGEAFGGIFAPGLTWLFGAPGAVLIYAAAGALIALPERSWTNPRLGRRILATTGIFLIGMAVLQAWPGRGFWAGHRAPGSQPGTLAGMVQQMSQISQPRLFSSWALAFSSFDTAHGFAVNLFAVVALGAIGIAFLSGRQILVRYAVIAGCVLCVADWVLIEDFGFFGGVGTDPNSMIPMAMMFVAGYLGIAKLPVAMDLPIMEAEVRNVSLATLGVRDWRQRVAISAIDLTEHPIALLRVFGSLCALGIILIGAAPMAAASVNPNADPIISQATNGTPSFEDRPSPNFRLVSADGHVVSLASLRGKTVALTFLDPVCVSDCPIIAQEFREANGMLGTAASNVELVAIDLNPLYQARGYLVAFDNQEGLNRVRNWQFLTGSSAALARIWSSFGVQVIESPGGSMVAHSDVAYVIDSKGNIRSILDTNPGSGTAASKSSFAVTLASDIRQVMSES